ncbi:ArsR/SmtB family transcription factor [Alteribacillus iranensis]|uniref:Transcriptional regulator, ArsR family n=1 Tax=Alteribacillus iranensis TaxID=930128 RepID=A0A1I2DSZ1_9BACI|nr:metalloregulator ArsR/SmtB family transcription factor [Alteribacillus iranensis]SFE83804.1 transcriptional regulator, ArsR family [Alteribacillus iranensis]
MEKTVLHIERAASVLKLLGDKTRLTMAGLLFHRECCVCEFVEVFNMSQPSISQHLRKLRDAGVVRERRKGQWVFYSLNQESEAYPLIETLITHVPDQKEKLDVLERKRMICD